MPESETTSDIAGLTVQLLSAYLSNNTVAADDLAGLIRTTRAALIEDTAPAQAEPEVQSYTPAVSVRKSLSSPDHILSLIDGKPYKTLKRHLASNGLTPQQYRERYNLPASYPMVAPTFTARRREIAEQIGLGNRRQTAAKAAAADKEAAAPAVQSVAADTASTPAPAAPAKRAPATKAKSKPAKSGGAQSAAAPSAAEAVKPAAKKAATKPKAAGSKAAEPAAAETAPAAGKPAPKRKLGLFNGGSAKSASEKSEATAEATRAASTDAGAKKAPAKPARGKRMAREPKQAAPANKAE